MRVGGLREAGVQGAPPVHEPCSHTTKLTVTLQCLALSPQWCHSSVTSTESSSSFLSSVASVLSVSDIDDTCRTQSLSLRGSG